MTELGIEESVGFLGSGDGRVFAALHAPLGPCSGGVLICPPLHGESTHNYRREVLLARGLAARGIAALRLHYRGTGHSDGDVKDMTFTSFCDDASMAWEHLASSLRGAPVAFFGTRLGACVAAATAARCVNAPIALWEPVLKGQSYFRELFRMKLISDASGGAEVAESTESLLRRLKEQGSTELVGGFVIGRDLYEEVVAVDTSHLLGQTKDPILLVQIDSAQEVRRPYRSLVDDLRNSGRTVDLAVVQASESWWLSRGPDTLRERSEAVGQLVDKTVAWAVRTLAMKVPT
jgi:pimeloyl-ACP methyl ester carboxylesterase